MVLKSSTQWENLFCVTKLSNKFNNEFIQKKKDSESSDNCGKERKTKITIPKKGTILSK